MLLNDVDRLLDAFACGGLRSFDAFLALAAKWRVLDFFATHNLGTREPPKDESGREYTSLLFESVVRRAVEPGRPFDLRLGALYLLLLLHERQPNRPRAPVPVLESQFRGFETLRDELRTLRHPDGFAALHKLWAHGRMEHRAGDQSSTNVSDLHHEAEIFEKGFARQRFEVIHSNCCCTTLDTLLKIE